MDFGSEEHQMETFLDAQEAWVLHRKGSKPKSGRWFQIFEKPTDQEPHWALMEMILMYIGAIEGWDGDPLAEVSALTSAPGQAPKSACSAAGKPSSASKPLPGGDAVGPAEGDSRQVALSNKDVEAMRKSTKNLMHLTMCLFGKVSLRALWMLLTAASMPIKEAHGKFLVMQKIKGGAEEWSIAMACGAY